MMGWKKMLGAAALTVACAQAWAVPTLSFSAPAGVLPGTSVGVDVNIADISDLYSYQFSVDFDPALLEATDVSQGDFLANAGATFGDTGSVNNAVGRILFVFNTLLGPQAGASGSGNLLHITFNTLGSGVSDLVFSDVQFLDSTQNDAGGNLIPVDVRNGTLAVGAAEVPEPGSWLLVGVGALAAAALRRRGGGRQASLA